MARMGFGGGVAFLLLAAGCATEQKGRYDPWYSPSPLEFFNGGPDKLEAVPFAVVTANEAKAVGRLTDQPWVEISEAEAGTYLAASVGGTDGRLYLLRAPCLKGDPGSFTVTRRKPRGDVQVLFQKRGRDSSGVTEHRAVIARLTAPPTDLFPDEL
jgi:hypothetical protein